MRRIENKDWNCFCRHLEGGMNIDETYFYFSNDPNETKDGCELKSATELVDAPIFDGKSLRERWDKVVICSIEGVSFDKWLKYMKLEVDE